MSVLDEVAEAIAGQSYTLGLYAGTLLALLPSVLPGAERERVEAVIASLERVADHLQDASDELCRARETAVRK